MLCTTNQKPKQKRWYLMTLEWDSLINYLSPLTQWTGCTTDILTCHISKLTGALMAAAFHLRKFLLLCALVHCYWDTWWNCWNWNPPVFLLLCKSKCLLCNQAHVLVFTQKGKRIFSLCYSHKYHHDRLCLLLKQPEYLTVLWDELQYITTWLVAADRLRNKHFLIELSFKSKRWALLPHVKRPWIRAESGCWILQKPQLCPRLSSRTSQVSAAEQRLRPSASLSPCHTTHCKAIRDFISPSRIFSDRATTPCIDFVYNRVSCLV